MLYFVLHTFFLTGIKLVKNRLYRCLRQLGVRSWPDYLPTITRDINNTALITLGYEKPSSVLSSTDEPRVRAAQEKLQAEMSLSQRNQYFPPALDWKQQEENRRLYDETPSHLFNLGSYVYADLTTDSFSRGFDYKRGRILRIKQIHTEKDPVRYILEGLLGEYIPGSYTASSLKICPEDPTSKEFWQVSHIKKHRVHQGRKQVLVSYLFYPSLYDTWIDEKDIVPASNLK